jgi:PHD/YefM family antitoxin component YafN of YafNO toxin-antitoxin module
MPPKTDSRAEPTHTTTISVTDLRTHLAKHLEVAHYNDRRFLIERNHEPFAVLLGVEEYRRLLAAGAQCG